MIRRLLRRLRGQRPKRRAPRNELLLAYTGRDSAWWVLRVQELINVEFRRVQQSAPRDPSCTACSGTAVTIPADHRPDCTWQAAQVHPPCKPTNWLRPLVRDVVETLPPDDGQPYDENMRTAAVLATALTAWTSRIGHAKAYDPNRPLELRREALNRHAGLVRALIDAAIDERQDADYFPDQEWNPPYGPSARGGDFV